MRLSHPPPTGSCLAFFSALQVGLLQNKEADILDGLLRDPRKLRPRQIDRPAFNALAKTLSTLFPLQASFQA